ncbi:nucleoside deaminase [Actinoplanes friuliensis]|uniref:Zinc-binding CMP/dCMP deaminase n=1 Tax=Actinoplanes friuliensis DSM 7358 TaxID=1246995 RepID=U5VZ91_9ACTN|nr:nucleoside deaminase [Actinoplanes friuliensis]AGZ42067.1 zinc-binding CMP/dCMP deaminase [Actinoplanes friuliensis DSM 7358]
MTTVDVDALIGARFDEDGALARAVELAGVHAAAGQLPFVALVVRDGVVIGGGANSYLEDHDPSGHGEVVAIRDATRRLGRADLGGAIVYSSCEPCAICRLVAAAAGVREIVFAADKGLVPAAIDSDPVTTGRLIDAVTAVLPAIARRGRTGADPSVPFTIFGEKR